MDMGDLKSIYCNLFSWEKRTSPRIGMICFDHSKSLHRAAFQHTAASAAAARERCIFAICAQYRNNLCGELGVGTHFCGHGTRKLVSLKL
jgi:hypothetical protein